MKKHILILLILAFVSFGASAQFGRAAKLPLAVGDTAVNTTAVSKIFIATAGYNAVSIQHVITKQSGTVAGIARLYGSLDGVNYVATGDTLTLANVTTNTTIWKITNTPYVYHKITVTGSGTMAALVSIWHILRKSISQ
jgi:starvation-inducible outer membrane lipoprotein